MVEREATTAPEDWLRHAFVLTDIESSTLRWQADTSAMADDLAHHDKLVESTMFGAGATDGKGLGDGFLFRFPDSSAAVAACIELQNELARTDWPGGPLAVRIGVDVGRAQSRAGDYFGLAINRCARVMGAAVGGQILTTRDVVAEVADRPEVAGRLHHHGPCRLKDLGEPVEIWEVLHEGRAGPSPPVALGDGLNNLPVGFSSFVGRQDDLAELAGVVTERALVTLTGSGGVGKTRLALQLAAKVSGEFPHGTWLVQLDGADTDEEVVGRVMAAMGLRSVVGLPDSDRLRSALSGRNMLLLLDCCEHVLEGAREVVAAVGGSSVRILATSRRPIGIPGELVWRVRSLGTDPESTIRGTARQSEARTLLEQRVAERGQPVDFSDPVSSEAADRIVRRLDGIPLAIELAAARLGVLDPVSLDAKLADGLPLADSTTQRPPRHQTIDATIEWSDRLLSPPARLLLRRMSVFATSPDLDALEAVCSEDLGATVVDAIAELVDASLAAVADIDGERHFAVLDAVDAYADSRWEEEDRRRTLVHYAHWAAALAAVGGPTVHLDAGWLSRLLAVDDDLSRAMAWLFDHDPEAAVTMAGNLAVYWVVSGQSREGREWTARALDAGVSIEPDKLAVLLEGGGIAASLDAEYDRSADLLGRSAQLFEDVGRIRRASYPRFWQARSTIVRAYQGEVGAEELAAATDLLDLAVRGFRDHDDLLGQALALPYVGWARMLQGADDPKAPLREGMELARASGIARLGAYAKAHLAHVVLVVDDDPTEAARLLEDVLGELRPSGDRQNLLICLLLRGAIELRHNRLDEAARVIAESASIMASGSSREWEPAVLSLGWATAALEDTLLASTIEGHLEENFPSWRTLLVNTGLGPVLEAMEGSLGAQDDLVRRTAFASGRKLAPEQLVETIRREFADDR